MINNINNNNKNYSFCIHNLLNLSYKFNLPDYVQIKFNLPDYVQIKLNLSYKFNFADLYSPFDELHLYKIVYIYTPKLKNWVTGLSYNLLYIIY